MLASSVRQYNRDHMIHLSHAVGASNLVSLIVLANRCSDGTWDTEEHGWRHPVGKDANILNWFVVLQRVSKHDDGSLAYVYNELAVCLCLMTGNIFYFSPAYKSRWYDIVYGKD